MGTERGQPFIGQSLIVGPNGFTLAGPADRIEDAILIAEVDPDSLETVRQVNEFNNKHLDRRRDVYS